VLHKRDELVVLDFEKNLQIDMPSTVPSTGKRQYCHQQYDDKGLWVWFIGLRFLSVL